jgi:hypothetical protein
VLRIDDLPDDDLLAIFDFYAYQYLDFRLNDFGKKRKIESWQLLVHVCRRWRCLVFGSPRRLNLQLYCTTRTFARKSLDIWPALPLLIKGEFYESEVDKVIAGLEHSDRIRQIDLDCYDSSITFQIKELWTAMQVPFPELARLYLSFGHLVYGPPWPVLPDSFLGGSAPRLRFLYLEGIVFPGLPNLLLSATHLVNLYLHNIPHSGYISPEAMTTSLSVMTSLETLELEFESPQSYPDLDSRGSFPPTRFVLPTLTNIWFKGVNEYLEEFVARIDAPRLYRLETTFFNDTDFNTPELSRFISRTPTLGAYDEAHLVFGNGGALVRLCPSDPEPSDHRIKILCKMPDRQLSALAKICTSLRPLLTMENLYINRYLDSQPVWVVWEHENTEWLDLLLPFTAVKNLYLSKLFALRIARALQELTGARTTEVLPALQNVLLEESQPSEPVHQGIVQFISARQLIDRPVAIICLA